MKTSKTYRLSNDTLESLDDLSQRLKMNHTQVIEMVLEQAQVVSQPEITLIPPINNPPDLVVDLLVDKLSKTTEVSANMTAVSVQVGILGIVQATLRIWNPKHHSPPTITFLYRVPGYRHCETYVEAHINGVQNG